MLREKPADVPRRFAILGVISAAILAASCERQTTAGDADRGKAAIHALGCGACHEIAGIRSARGRVGPPLLAVGRQAYIAGILPNTPANLSRWLQNPPAVAPLTAMPNLGITPAEARDMVAYLYTLRGDQP